MYIGHSIFELGSLVAQLVCLENRGLCVPIPAGSKILFIIYWRVLFGKFLGIYLAARNFPFTLVIIVIINIFRDNEISRVSILKFI